jgi:hypothetical protein
MSCTELITAIKDVLLGGAAVTTTVVAVVGLKNWSRELRGRADFDVARGLIRATYKLRDEIRSCRAAFIMAQEFPDGYCDPNRKSTPEDEAQVWAHVYKNRWQPVWEAIQEFDAQTLEAEALWGSEIRQKTDKLRECIAELNSAIYAVISDKASGGRDFKSDREFGKKMRSTVSASGSDQSNELSKKITEAVTGIEDKIRPHLKRS